MTQQEVITFCMNNVTKVHTFLCSICSTNTVLSKGCQIGVGKTEL